MTQEEIELVDKIAFKRIEIARALFSPQCHNHRESMARKVVALSVELVALVTLLSRNDR